MTDDDEGQGVVRMIKMKLGRHMFIVPTSQEGVNLETMRTEDVLNLRL